MKVLANTRRSFGAGILATELPFKHVALVLRVRIAEADRAV
jgi:hypothetical protein